ncbi:hypothetical protein GQS52_01560 [Streptomyces sp. SCUT-3]|uniref:hypothetical protein n=1 Tax=Streptomyces sp. SCUT-3 TaxID=2684469 RepID=UPI000CB81078|nr:hypothetical protein [Streptomyces sp. SCUT-3]PLW71237.1 hypothetical protein C0036_18885 [Streptomyces sp. DJ]QMV20703.1 hypothetical protein GQS52_01560 [Streptomyces sp. SCUT-3]
MGDVPLIELRIPRGALPRRMLMAFLGICGGCGALALLLKASGLPGGRTAGALALAFLLASVGAAAAMRGDDPAFTADGVRLKAFAWDRGQVLVPWSEIDRVWIGRFRGYDYLYVLPRDPERHVRAGGLLRARIMARVAADRGSALQIHLPADGLPPDRVRTAVEEFSGGTVRLGPAPRTARAGSPNQPGRRTTVSWSAAVDRSTPRRVLRSGRAGVSGCRGARGRGRSAGGRFRDGSA